MRFLVTMLAITALPESFGINLLHYRRAIGVLAFYYAALHLTTYVVLDQGGLDFGAVWADILQQPYITIGMLNFITLVPAPSHR